MLLEGKLTKAQKLIIRHICSIQLESLQRIYNDEADFDNNEAITSILKRNEVEEEEFEDELMLRMNDFEKLHQDPDRLHVMTDSNLSAITHIMTNIADRYEAKYPNAVRNIWGKLFFIRDVKVNFSNN